jgi:hypothetical protein
MKPVVRGEASSQILGKLQWIDAKPIEANRKRDVGGCQPSSYFFNNIDYFV